MDKFYAAVQASSAGTRIDKEQVRGSLFSKKEDAEAEAKMLAATSNETHFVMEVISGFGPIERVKQIQFK